MRFVFYDLFSWSYVEYGGNVCTEDNMALFQISIFHFFNIFLYFHQFSLVFYIAL